MWILVAPKSPLGKQLAELSGKGSPFLRSGDSQVVGDTSECLHALWSTLSFPPPYFCQKRGEDQSHLHSSTQSLMPCPCIPMEVHPWAAPYGGICIPQACWPFPSSGDAGSPLEQGRDPMCSSCCCGWESKGQGEVPVVPRCPMVTSATWNLRHLWYVQPHHGVGTKGVFQWLEIAKAATPASHSNSHHALLLNGSHLCYSLLSSVPAHDAEVHCWPLCFI